jgi:hypothetical protein
MCMHSGKSLFLEINLSMYWILVAKQSYLTFQCFAKNRMSVHAKLFQGNCALGIQNFETLYHIYVTIK